MGGRANICRIVKAKAVNGQIIIFCPRINDNLVLYCENGGKSFVIKSNLIKFVENVGKKMSFHLGGRVRRAFGK